MEDRPVIEIIVNGEPRQTAAETTVAELITALQLTPERLALELNLSILPRSAWSETRLHAGDRLEIVHFVGGGV